MEAIADGEVDIIGDVKDSLEQEISSNPSLINSNSEVKTKWLATYGISDRGGEIQSYNENTGRLITKGPYATTVSIGNNLNGAEFYKDGSIILPGEIGVKGGDVRQENGDLIISSDNIDISKASGEFIAEPGSETMINGLGIQITDRTIVNVGSGYTEFDVQGNEEIELYSGGRKRGSIYGDFKLYDNLNFDLYAGSEYRDSTDYFKVSKLTQFRNSCLSGSISCVENGDDYVKIYAKGGNKIEYGTSTDISVFVDEITDNSKVLVYDDLNKVGTNKDAYIITNNRVIYRGNPNKSTKLDVIVRKNDVEYYVFDGQSDRRVSNILHHFF
jgi:hypothetical protein